MNQKLLSGFTAALLISTFGLAPSGSANQPESEAESEARTSTGASTHQVASTSSFNDLLVNPEVAQPATSDRAEGSIPVDLTTPTAAKVPAAPQVSAPAATQEPDAAPSSDLVTPHSEQAAVEVVKVGEYQTQEAVRQEASGTETTVATIHPHLLQGRHAATLYVRNIPVLTFLGEAAPAQNSIEPAAASGAEVKVASVQSSEQMAASTTAISTADKDFASEAARLAPEAPSEVENSSDPVWRATTTAARLNQLHRDQVDAGDIQVSWNRERRQYVIGANDTEIIAVDDNTVLPDTATNAGNDILQATNRIRRQMGNASPLSRIEGDPDGAEVARISLGNLQLRVSGLASWYGPGFDGNYSASGEVFNQEAMTAAHPSLPFGTQVKVTNLDNGQSVVVRINDRGPYAHGRVIDLSAGAARIIGLVSSGVAPVSLEVMGIAAQAASN